MAKKIQDPTTQYIFCGEGEGIPGLPREVTLAEAEALGLTDTLTAALLGGTYREVKAAARPEPADEGGPQ